MYASLYKMPNTSILDNRKFINNNSVVYEAPPKVNKYIPDETIEEKVNYSYGPDLKDRGAGEIYSYRYNANYVGNRDVDNGVISILDTKKRRFDPVSVIQLDRTGKDKIDSKDSKDKDSKDKDTKGNGKNSKDVKESYEEKSPKSKDLKENKKNEKEEETCSSGTCTADGNSNICGNDKLYPIMDPRFNLREASKNMILLEDHLFHMGKRCKDCILKHCLTIEGFLEEGITLDVTGVYTNVLQKAFDEFRIIFIEIASKCRAGNLTNEDCVKIAQQIRKIRKPLCQEYATFIK